MLCATQYYKLLLTCHRARHYLNELFPVWTSCQHETVAGGFDRQLWESHHLPLTHYWWTLRDGPVMSISTKFTTWMKESLWEQKHNSLSSCNYVLSLQCYLPVRIAQNLWLWEAYETQWIFCCIQLNQLLLVPTIFNSSDTSQLSSFCNPICNSCDLEDPAICCMGVWTLSPSTGVGCSCCVC